jgi:hypothetical protein
MTMRYPILTSGCSITASETEMQRGDTEVSLIWNYPAVATYPMDDNAANTTLTAAVGSSGALSANSSTLTSAGLLGTSILFNGTSNQSSCPLVMTVVNNYTISCWTAWGGGSGSAQVPVYNGTSASNGYGIYLSSNTGAVHILHGGVQDFTTNKTVSSSGWTHLVYLRSAGTASVYVNNVQSTTTASTPLTPTSATWIGSSGGAGYFKGAVDEVMIFIQFWCRKIYVSCIVCYNIFGYRFRLRRRSMEHVYF